MRLKDLPIIFHESKHLFQVKVAPHDLYLSMIMFSHMQESTYKPILQYIHGVAQLANLDYSGITDTSNPNQRKIYNTLYIFDILRAEINHWILNLRHLKQPYELMNSVENLYEKMDILSDYSKSFAISDISIINSAKFPENAEKEITKRSILLQKILTLFSEPFAPDLFDITEIDFHKLTSRYLLNTEHFNLVDRHIKCTPKKAFDICSKNMNFLSKESEFENFTQYCSYHFSKLLFNLAQLGKQKRLYLEINKNFPSQAFSGYFINELDNDVKRKVMEYAHTPEFAPQFKLFDPKIEEYNLLPFLVTAFAPNNHSNVFNAPIRFLLEHNRKLSFLLNGIIDSILPYDFNCSPNDYLEELNSLSITEKKTVSYLQQLKKLSQYVSFEITTNINKLLFVNTSSEYNRTLSNLHETIANLEAYVEVYGLSSNEIAECSLTNYESSLIENYMDTLINCFADVQRTSEELYQRFNNGIELLSSREFFYWKFISLTYVEDSDIDIPEKLAYSSVHEFCDILKTSYTNFMDHMGVTEEDKILQEIIENEITTLIVRYCQFFDKSNFFKSLLGISKQHLLEDKSNTAPTNNGKDNKNTNILSIIFKDPPLKF